MSKLLLIDGDILCFQHAVVNEMEFVWDDETTSDSIDFDSAVFGLEGAVKAMLERTKAREAVFAFSSSPSFRYDILPTYKHNRKGDKPKLLTPLMEYVEETYRTWVRPRLEADDVLGILGTITPGRYILASIDKDLKQIPGTHYNWQTDELDTITEEEADRFFYLQVLTGDSTDGYKGCPGIGPKRATRILDEAEGDPWSAIVAAYEAKGLTEDDALQQARVARILRKSDYDFERKQPRLWTPR